MTKGYPAKGSAMSHRPGCVCPICLPLAPSTNALWLATHEALAYGRWSLARAYLDDLGRRSDVVDSLLNVEQYVALSGRPLHADYVAVLADRIDLVNSKVGR